MMKPTLMTSAQIQNFCGKIQELCGLNLQRCNQEMIQSQLLGRLAALQIRSFEEYFEYLDGGLQSTEIVWLMDALKFSINRFFHEKQHFVFLREQILPKFREKKMRLWSAACSAGEEPYSMAMLLAETVPCFDEWKIEILATDSLKGYLHRAQAGVYETDALDAVPENWRRRYFEPALELGERKWRVDPQLQQMISFVRLDYMDELPTRGLFDVVFCRNPLICFDSQTHEKLLEKFYNLIVPGGYLFVSGSERLADLRHDFKYIQPAIYRK